MRNKSGGNSVSHSHNKGALQHNISHNMFYTCNGGLGLVMGFADSKKCRMSPPILNLHIFLCG